MNGVPGRAKTYTTSELTRHHNYSPKVGRTLEQAIEAFMVRVDMSPNPSGCWIWKSKSGYIYWKKNYIPARFSFIFLKNGEFPEGKPCVLHTCDNVHGYCVNPEHLWAGSKKDNSQDMAQKQRGTGRRFCSHCGKRLTCPDGHLLL